MGVNSLPKTVTRQRRDGDLNPGLLRLSPARYPLGHRATLDTLVESSLIRDRSYVLYRYSAL